MINILKHTRQDVYVIGDLHGNFGILEDYIRERDFISNCIIIVAGDCGFGFKPLHAYIWEMEQLNFVLLQKNCILYMIRGNHDDPDYFAKEKIKLSNVFTIPDYSIIQVDNYNILCVGGGLSIDRKYRLSDDKSKEEIYKGLDMSIPLYPSYWENEMPLYNEKLLDEINESGICITHVVTHTSPSFCFKHGFKGIEKWLENDDKLLTDLQKERQVITDIYDKLMKDKHPVMRWIYGHFHKHYEENINTIHFIALHNIEQSLDIGELTPQN
jgi:predicted phosphodiesterase